MYFLSVWEEYVESVIFILVEGGLNVGFGMEIIYFCLWINWCNVVF